VHPSSQSMVAYYMPAMFSAGLRWSGLVSFPYSLLTKEDGSTRACLVKESISVWQILARMTQRKRQKIKAIKAFQGLGAKVNAVSQLPVSAK